MKKKKRNIIINKKFQLSLALSFAGISALSMTIIIVICSTILINNDLKLKNINENQQLIAELQKDHNNTNIDLYNKNNEKIYDLIHKNNGLIIILIVSSILQVLLIFYLMLRRSHRISGPMYLMNNYFTEIIKGNYPVIRPLRRDDDFKALFDKLRIIINILHENSKDSAKGKKSVKNLKK